MITYGSLCSGIGSESIPWKRLGWVCKWNAEVEPYCCSLLKYRYPDVPNLGDVRKIPDAKVIPKVKLIVGGTPCQSFSVNARRDGMADARGRLAYVFMEIVVRVRPTWIVWENVANALRVEGGRAFGSIVGAMEKCGYGWTYRILDLRDFGLPQQRQRLFLVGHRGDCRPAIVALLGRLPTRKDKEEVNQMEKESMERTRLVDGWAGDETPKRGMGVSVTLRATQGGEGVGVIEGYKKLRRFTTSEWEKLQGFPVGYTKCRHKNKQASNKMRQKALGNSFPPPILKWLGERIQAIEEYKIRERGNSPSLMSTKSS